MKSIALLLLLIGIILITIGISKTNTETCPTKIETRTVSTNYLNEILSGPDNYKNIFEFRNIGIHDSDANYKDSNTNFSDNLNTPNNDLNIHNVI